MKEKLISAYWRGKLAVKDFFEKEKGASEIVVILVLIVVIIAVAKIFQEQLTNAVKTAFNTLNNYLKK